VSVRGYVFRSNAPQTQLLASTSTRSQEQRERAVGMLVMGAASAVSTCRIPVFTKMT
jgi:hypothetical protein